MKSELLSLVLPDDRVRKITRPCPFCTHKYERTSGCFGLYPSASALNLDQSKTLVFGKFIVTD